MNQNSIRLGWALLVRMLFYGGLGLVASSLLPNINGDGDFRPFEFAGLGAVIGLFIHVGMTSESHSSKSQL